MVDRLMERVKNHEVIVLDNLSSGDENFITLHRGKQNFQFHKVDILHDDISPFFDGVE